MAQRTSERARKRGDSQDDVEGLGAGAVHEAEVPAEDVVDAGDVLELAELEEEKDGRKHAVRVG